MPKASVVPNKKDATKMITEVVRPSAVATRSPAERNTEAICKSTSNARRSTTSPTAGDERRRLDPPQQL
jgi:hypothetical protein